MNKIEVSVKGEWEKFQKYDWFGKALRKMADFSIMNNILEQVCRNTFKRGRRGLFGTTGKIFGNNVSHSERK